MAEGSDQSGHTKRNTDRSVPASLQRAGERYATVTVYLASKMATAHTANSTYRRKSRCWAPRSALMPNLDVPGYTECLSGCRRFYLGEVMLCEARVLGV